jgi:hypothetical protein
MTTMKNKTILLFLAGLGLVIIAVIIIEFTSTRPDRQSGNPYKYEIDDYLQVKPEMILYREIRNMKLQMAEPAGISYQGQKLYVAGDEKLLCFDLKGNIIFEIQLNAVPWCVKATPGEIYVGCAKQILAIDPDSHDVSLFSSLNDSSLITSIDVSHDQIFAADAGKRLVYRINRSGEKEMEIEGKSEEDDLHGFILPSPNFDLAFNSFGELWIANPGKHALENYTPEGKLREWWSNASADLKGFSGCCNPANFAFLPDGNFITSEKGLVRIKEYKPSGEFVGVVAPPALFGDEVVSPDIAVDESGIVYALDKERKMIRIFDKK